VENKSRGAEEQALVFEHMFQTTASLVDRAEALLETRFGLEAFRPGQREVIAALYAHRAALGVCQFPDVVGLCICEYPSPRAPRWLRPRPGNLTSEVTI
jgi:hypothetical protein